MDLEIATDLNILDEEEAKWSDKIPIIKIYGSRKITKEVSRKELLIHVVSYDEITEEFILLLKNITIKKLAINFYFPNYIVKTRVELVLGTDKLSFIPSKEFIEMLQNL